MSALSERYPAAFVTGASSGLGRAFAAMLATDGVEVWASSRRGADGFAPEALGERIHPIALDLARPDEAVAAFNAAAAVRGRPFELVVNNAGYGIFGEFAGVEAGAWEAQVAQMLGTSLRLCHAAWTAWAAEGPRTGNMRCLVNVSSLAVEFPLPYLSGYNAAKAGLSALSESLVLEGRRLGIRVVDFRPGDYRTGFNRAARRPQEVAGAPAAVWEALERNLRAAPPPERAAADLRRALLRGRSGTVRSGTWFQARVAPFFSQLLPQAWQRAISSRYFGAA